MFTPIFHKKNFCPATITFESWLVQVSRRHKQQRVFNDLTILCSAANDSWHIFEFFYCLEWINHSLLQFRTSKSHSQTHWKSLSSFCLATLSSYNRHENSIVLHTSQSCDLIVDEWAAGIARTVCVSEKEVDKLVTWIVVLWISSILCRAVL